MRHPFRFLPLFFLILTVLTGAGCAQRTASGVVRVAVMDGIVAEGKTETRQSVAGWWLGTHDRFDSGTAGVVLADTLAKEFQEMPGVEIYSRLDLASYMAQKERLLARNYPEMTPPERLMVLQEQDPVDYGKSLNVDYIMTSKVSLSRTTHNRTFHWWASEVDFNLEVWDVDSGQRIWQWRGHDRDLFDSQLAMMEELAREARSKATRLDVFHLYN